MPCGSGCGCGSQAGDPSKDEDLKGIKAPEPPQISPRISEMKEEDREGLRKRLQGMAAEEIQELSDEEFSDFATWIMEYTSWLYSTAEHKVIMAVVANDYKNWFDVFLERYGTP